MALDTADRKLPPIPWRAEIAGYFRESAAPITGNFSLTFERYAPVWQQQDGEWDTDAKQLEALAPAFEGLKKGQKEHLKAHNKRIKAVVESMKGERRVVTTDARLAIGLGAEHPAENSLCLDYSLGVPYLPGSGLKGLCRAWAALQEVPEARRTELFGRDPDDNEAEDATGRLVFFSAWPSSWPRLEMDIVNCHLPTYFGAMRGEGGDRGRRGSGRSGSTAGVLTPKLALPTDNPVPVFFLTVASGTRFYLNLASLAADERQRQEDVDEGMTLLLEALEVLGFGAKTATGYGVFTQTGDDLRTLIVYMNADMQPDARKMRKAADIKGPADVVSLLPLDGSPLLNRFGPAPEPVDWKASQQKVDQLARETRRRRASTSRLIVHGHAPLPLFYQLGYRMTAWSCPTDLVNQRRAGTWDRISPEGMADEAFFGQQPVWPVEAQKSAGLVALYISIRGGEPDLDDLLELADQAGEDLLNIHLLTTDQLLDAEHGASAAEEIKGVISRIPGHYPKATGLIMCINGSAPLAYLAGRATNPNLFRRVLVPDFERGRYVAAVELRR